MPQVARDPTAQADGVHFAWQLSSTAQDVRNVLTRAAGTLADAGLGSEDAITLEMVTAEALNNVVEHAYADTDHGQIQIDLVVGATSLALTVSDRGQEMPGGQVPLKAPMTSPEHLAVSDLPEGGWGWQVIHNCATSISYQRVNGENRLQIMLDRAAVPDNS